MAFFSSYSDDFRATSHSKPFCTSGATVPLTLKVSAVLHTIYVFGTVFTKKATISSNRILISVAAKRPVYCAVGTDVLNAVSSVSPLTTG